MGLLKDIGITKGITETGKIFESLFGEKTFALGGRFFLMT